MMVVVMMVVAEEEEEGQKVVVAAEEEEGGLPIQIAKEQTIFLRISNDTAQREIWFPYCSPARLKYLDRTAAKN